MIGRHSPSTRARDADRAAVRARLDAAYADGQLSGAEHEVRDARAGAADTLGELDELVADLQASPDAAAAARVRAWGPWVFAGAVVTAAVVAGVATFRWVRADPPPAGAQQALYLDPAALRPVVVPTPSLVTRAGLEQYRADHLAAFGDALVDKVDFFEQHASITRSVPDVPDRMVSYTYRGGFDPDHAPRTRAVDTPVVDLATLDVDEIARYVAGAPQSVGVPDGTVGHISVGFSYDQPSVRIFVRNTAGETGFLEVTPQGELIELHRFENRGTR
ncbi:MULTISPECIES: DUF1707 SHOCT-like domain-containing protein [unclassified Rhodococcus (in: high G+C Gram-positive bacteria)]|uniref:DUF1707 SHOCT-like domain-containing protein n=1 Tax=unclassified Rhodococcus (in: high G+C Gram-positive bacteria) TaxID=192944 RepID=UPI000925E4D2|nr:DUF1707 domain-containing protein [Rhodococcus sp. M8]OLL19741.1 hypothetical protein BKE56_006990 [Rhodococcus sp. M8]QPG43582.1 DUF1707 domain-containing protein [Rhodococcus sp. M8]